MYRLPRDGNFWIVDTEINAWSWSFIHLQINLIFIQYPVQSVVLGNQTPIRSQGILLLTNERREREFRQFLRKIQKCQLWISRSSESWSWVWNTKVPSSRTYNAYFNMSNIELIFRLHENKEPKTHHREISYSTIKKLKLKGSGAI